MTLSISLPIAALTSCGGTLIYCLAMKGRYRCKFKDFCNCKCKCRKLCNCVNCCRKRNTVLREASRDTVLREASRERDVATGRDTVTFVMPPNIFIGTDSLDSSFTSQSQPSTFARSPEQSSGNFSTSVNPSTTNDISTTDNDFSNTLTNVTPNSEFSNVILNAPENSVNGTSQSTVETTSKVNSILSSFMNTVRKQFDQKSKKAKVKTLPESTLTNMYETSNALRDISSNESDGRLTNMSNISIPIPMHLRSPIYSSSPYHNEHSFTPEHASSPMFPSPLNDSRVINQSHSFDRIRPIRPSSHQFGNIRGIRNTPPITPPRINESSMFFTPPIRFRPTHISQPLRSPDSDLNTMHNETGGNVHNAQRINTVSPQVHHVSPNDPQNDHVSPNEPQNENSVEESLQNHVSETESNTPERNPIVPHVHHMSLSESQSNSIESQQMSPFETQERQQMSPFESQSVSQERQQMSPFETQSVSQERQQMSPFVSQSVNDSRESQQMFHSESQNVSNSRENQQIMNDINAESSDINAESSIHSSNSNDNALEVIERNSIITHEQTTQVSFQSETHSNENEHSSQSETHSNAFQRETHSNENDVSEGDDVSEGEHISQPIISANNTLFSIDSQSSSDENSPTSSPNLNGRRVTRTLTNSIEAKSYKGMCN